MSAKIELLNVFGTADLRYSINNDAEIVGITFDTESTTHDFRVSIANAKKMAKELLEIVSYFESEEEATG